MKVALREAPANYFKNFKNLGAVVQERVYEHIDAPPCWIAWIYDKDQPRELGSEDPVFRFACVGMLGPFPTKSRAMTEVRRVIGP